MLKRTHLPTATRVILLIAAATCSLPSGAADPSELYQTKIKPLLRERCFSCHGALKDEAGLRVDTVAQMLDGGIITAGDATDSTLIERVSTADVSERMPPEHEGEPLTAEHLQWLKDWIQAGAKAPENEQPEADPESHWAFQPITRPPIPEVANTSWVRNPIDSFVAAGHEKHGLKPQPEASRTALIRRLYMDLIGLPPTAEEFERHSQDSDDEWYQAATEQLLNDPRHGERWGRHWMDVWRFSDWWGLNAQLRNSQRHMWHWRDWIVESLNEDKPYDEMVRLMLAADELQPNDIESLRASGYLARNFFLFNRNQWMEETVEHVGKGFLGLTFNCAKCHDHKYDPITQVEYYKLRAFFEPYQVRLDMVPGETDFSKDGIPRAFDAIQDAPTYRLIRGEEGNPDKSTVIAPGMPEFLTGMDSAAEVPPIQTVELPPEAWQPNRRNWVQENYLKAAETKQQQAIAKLEASPDSESAVLAASLAEAQYASLKLRIAYLQSQWDNASEETLKENRSNAIRSEQQVQLLEAKIALLNAQGQLAKASEDKKEALTKKQTEKEKAVKQAEAALTEEIKADAKVTPIPGARWTPTRFQHTGKDDPPIAFPATSSGRRTALANWITDSRNPLTARVAANHIWARHFGDPLVASMFDFGRNGSAPKNPQLLNWLASELIDSGWSMKHLHRLIVQSSTYRMQSTVAGAEANLAIDPDNQYWWRRSSIRLESQVLRDSILSLAGDLDATIGGPSIPAAQQEKSKRRSLYFFHSNNQRALFLTMFDEALVTDCYLREQSIVPQQALALSNSEFVLSAAEKIAQKLSQPEDKPADFINKAFQQVLGIDADSNEIEASEAALESWQALPEGSAEKARARLVWVLINHNDFVTLR
ncbi:Planctomycete cytochrome C [Roseimaritima multifibrata]|uniref:Planctomycete cytochrome C n=1 Tax=Roseimaritima multifibrata TaxID=1930274 RepID=A0A517MAD5_9BACT|nr:PSD1 and planctomycete cytochrome C domain-containing protein [Roseimaritima multifibrata]QDS91850.1 Planctomycete cytochrome C [Roseimaritima multifibrata]